jgi:phage baseplate assembly protein V
LLEPTTDVIRQGKVSSVNYEAGRVRVLYTDKNDAVTAELPLESFEYDMPKVGERIYAAHQSNGVEKGVVLSRYWHDDEVPPEYGPHIWRKELRDYPTFPEGTYFKFDREKHTLTIRVVGSPEVSVEVIADKDVRVVTKGKAVVQAEKDVTVTAKENVRIEAEKNVTVTAKEKITVTAKDINLEGETHIGLHAETVEANGQKIG